MADAMRELAKARVPIERSGLSRTFAHHLAPSQRPDVGLRDCNAVVFGKAIESAPEGMLFGFQFAGRANAALVGMVLAIARLSRPALPAGYRNRAAG